MALLLVLLPAHLLVLTSTMTSSPLSGRTFPELSFIHEGETTDGFVRPKRRRHRRRAKHPSNVHNGASYHLAAGTQFFVVQRGSSKSSASSGSAGGLHVRDRSRRSNELRGAQRISTRAFYVSGVSPDSLTDDYNQFLPRETSVCHWLLLAALSCVGYAICEVVCG